MAPPHRAASERCQIDVVAGFDPGSIVVVCKPTGTSGCWRFVAWLLSSCEHRLVATRVGSRRPTIVADRETSPATSSLATCGPSVVPYLSRDGHYDRRVWRRQGPPRHSGLSPASRTALSGETKVYRFTLVVGGRRLSKRPEVIVRASVWRLVFPEGFRGWAWLWAAPVAVVGGAVAVAVTVGPSRAAAAGGAGAGGHRPAGVFA